VTENQMLSELIEWLRIPSISSGGGRPEALERAAEWAADRIRRAGGAAELVTGDGNPLVVGDLRSKREDAPTVLIYGHYDVQSPDPVNLWTSPPFEPEVRGDRLYSRGASDDKGNFYPLLYEACELAAAGELPVHVRVLIEGEEEVSGRAALAWIRSDTRHADCAIVFDGPMLDPVTPAITVGLRGIIAAAVEVRTARADLHSGLYGGSVLNALHVLTGVLTAVMPDADGLVPEVLREGIAAPTETELESWAELSPGGDVISAVGGRPLVADSGDRYYVRNWADVSVDVHGIEGGDANQVRTMVPSFAHAKLSIRLAPGQSAGVIAPRFEELMLAAAPPGADVRVEMLSTGEPAMFDPESPPLRLAAEALTNACGRDAVIVRSGGSIPVLAALAERDIPTVLSGFALPEDAIHAPDESYRLESLTLGRRAARALYQRLASLPRV
jgi:acetylornithine deacetylase/succinyl-diaminopimelate desuccinylase-like protein